MEMLSLFNFYITKIFSTLIIIIIIYVTYYYYKYFTRPNPIPGPLPLPIIGNLYQFNLYDYSKFLTNCYKKYGDLFEIYVANDRQICVGNLKDFDKLFYPSSRTNFKMRTLYKPGLDEFGVSGYGVVFNHNYNSWQYNRQFFTQAMLTPSFSRLSLSQFQNFLNDLTNQWNDLSDKNIEFDLRKWMFYCMTDTFLDLFVGKKGYSMHNYYSNLIGKKSIHYDKNNDYVEFLMEYVDGYTFHLIYGTIAKHVPILRGMAKKHIKNRDKYWNYLYNIIDEQKKFIEITPKDQLRDDMITLLLTANTDHDINNIKSKIKNEFQRPMNDKELMINLSEAIGAGVDTISNLFSFLIYHLVKNPKIINKIREEVVNVLGENPRPINVEDLDKFQYIEAVIKEASRINSLVPLVDRYNSVPDEVGGYCWPADTHFIVNASGTHIDSKFWENPEIFDPERFINLSPVNNHKALVLFGGGIRICPGRKLAMILMKVLTSFLIYNFDFELVNQDEQIKVRYSVFNQPHELYIRVKKRVN